MSLCDTCHTPGYCCRSMSVSGGDSVKGFLNTVNMSRDEALATAEAHGLPFIPLKTELRTAPDYAKRIEGWTWRYSCPRLQADGRCGDYENRPGLCRSYEPGQDRLCVYGDGWTGNIDADQDPV